MNKSGIPRDMPTGDAIKATHPVVQQVQDAIFRHGLLKPADNVLVAVSGGPDSVALLHIMMALAPNLKLGLAVAHLNHGLRPKAAANDQRFVTQLAQRHNLPVHCEHVCIDPSAPGSLEERCRLARYEFLNRLAQTNGCTKIATGHQADDNAEAVLLNLIRGSGTRGLSGIPPIRQDRIIRPLLRLTRDEIVDFLIEHNLPYVDDATNKDLRFDRNRIRHTVMPLLKSEFNPNIVATLNRSAELCRTDEQWFQDQIDQLMPTLVVQHTPEQLDLDASLLAQTPLAAQRRILRKAIELWHGELRRITAAHIASATALIDSSRVGKQCDLAAGIRIARIPKRLCLTRQSSRQTDRRSAIAPFEIQIDTESDLPDSFIVSGGTMAVSLIIKRLNGRVHDPTQKPDTAWFDLDQLTFPLIVRNMRAGDRFIPYGMSGSQKVKKLFIDRKVPRHRRDGIPILLSGPTIVWVVGVRRSNAAPITAETQRVLVVRAMRTRGNPLQNGP